MRKILKKLWFRITAGLLLVLFAAFYIYTLDYYKALPIAAETMAESQTVSIENRNNMIIFSPKDNKSDTGFAFYPGGKVEYLAYVPLMNELAKKGITCVLLKMPFNLAVFNINAAERAINALPEIKNWYIGGHSLGGVMASVYAAKNSEKLKGIIFLASYPSSDISGTNLKMLSIYGSCDGVLNMEKFKESSVKSPVKAKYIEIDGGNHAYFGTYGEQKGDKAAAITDVKQQSMTASAIANFVK